MSPESGAVKVASDSEIIIEFSEPVDEASLAASIFVSPSEEKLNYKVRGRRLIIKPQGGIPVDRPMTVTIGSGVKDLHGNALPISTSFAFTAGDSIRGGNIAGRIYGDPPYSGMLVGAWLYSDSLVVAPDTILAQYITQSGEFGEYILSYLPEGEYRVLCWDDKNRDKFFQPGSDRLGIAPKDVTVLADSTVLLDLYAEKRDTTTLSPLLISVVDDHHLKIRFSKYPNNFSTGTFNNLKMTDSSGNALDLRSSWLDPSDSSRVTFLTAGQIKDMPYEAVLEMNLAAVKAGDTTLFEFVGSPQIDTAAPALVRSDPAENSKDVALKPQGVLYFDDLIEGDSLLSSITLTVQDTLNISLTTSGGTANSLKWSSKETVTPGARCLLTVDLTKIFDSQGNVAGDSVKTFFFTTIDPAGKGEISGQVVATNQNYYVVSAWKVGKNRSEMIKTQVNEDGGFKLNNLTPGEYGLWCWKSLDAVKFNAGNLDPFRHCDNFTFLQDTITVRARWESGGVILRLP